MSTPPATTFYWHDYETFGLNTRIDRPAQFAGIRTSESLTEVGEPDIWYARAPRDVLPSPKACLVTGITPQVANENGMAECEFARAIYERMTAPGTISVGYNSMRFDDEVTRFLFWRNFLDVYARESKDGCSRWDLYPFVLAVWALRPQGIVWPEYTDEEGVRRISFRLEKLSEANHIEHSHAHDAASDVYATIGLARLIAEKQPRLWSFALKNRTRDRISAMLETGNACVWIDPHYRRDKGYIRVVAKITGSERRRTASYVWDLSEDPTVLKTLDIESVRRRVFTRSENLPEGETRLGLRVIMENHSPFVCNDLRVLNASVCERFGIDIAVIEANLRKLVAIRSEIVGTVIAAMEEREEKASAFEPDADTALYGGFFSWSDKERARELTTYSGEMLERALSEGRLFFEDKRAQTLLQRYWWHNFEERLSSEDRLAYRALVKKSLYEGREGFLTLESYQSEIDEAMQELDEARENGTMTEEQYEAKAAVLENLYAWGDEVAEWAEGGDK